jgi:hypothetical protein
MASVLSVAGVGDKTIHHTGAESTEKTKRMNFCLLCALYASAVNLSL